MIIMADWTVPSQNLSWVSPTSIYEGEQIKLLQTLCQIEDSLNLTADLCNFEFVCNDDLAKSKLRQMYVEKLSEYEALLEPRELKLFTCLYICVLLIGLIGNLLTITVIYKTAELHTHTIYYLCNLAVSDTILLLVGVPTDVWFIWTQYRSSPCATFCLLKNIIIGICTNASVMSILAMTLEMFIAICYGIQKKAWVNSHSMATYIATVWIAAAVPAVLMNSQYRQFHQMEPLCQQIMPNLAVCNVVDSSWTIPVSEVYLVVVFFVPFVLIFYWYCRILANLRGSVKNSRYSTKTSFVGTLRTQVVFTQQTKPTNKSRSDQLKEQLEDMRLKVPLTTGNHSSQDDSSSYEVTISFNGSIKSVEPYVEPTMGRLCTISNNNSANNNISNISSTNNNSTNNNRSNNNSANNNISNISSTNNSSTNNNRSNNNSTKKNISNNNSALNNMSNNNSAPNSISNHNSANKNAGRSGSALPPMNDDCMYMHNGRNMRQRAQYKVVKMMAVVALVFFLCYLPVHIQRLLNRLLKCDIYDPSDCEDRHNYLKRVWVLSGVLHFLSAAVNPIVYNLMDRKFRSSFRRCLYRMLVSKASVAAGAPAPPPQPR